MQITFISLRRLTIATCVGRIDKHTAVQFYTAVEAVLKQGKRNIVFDFSGVTFINSHGLRALLRIREECSRLRWSRPFSRGKVAIAEPTEFVRDTLELVGLQVKISLYDNLIEAVGSF